MAGKYKAAPIRLDGREIEYGTLKSPIKGSYGTAAPYQGRVERSFYPVVHKYEPQAVNYGNPVIPFYHDIKTRNRETPGYDFFMQKEDRLFRKYSLPGSDPYFSGKVKDNYLN